MTIAYPKAKRCPRCGGKLELYNGKQIIGYSHAYSLAVFFGNDTICDYTETIQKGEA